MKEEIDNILSDNSLFMGDKINALCELFGRVLDEVVPEKRGYDGHNKKCDCPGCYGIDSFNALIDQIKANRERIKI